MPIYDANHLEYRIDSGHITIIGEGGRQIPAYWAHPALGNLFPGIVLVHDWWGIDSVTRRLANFFAQMGYYVIVPDLFEGQQATTPQAALKLVERYKSGSYALINDSASVLEAHHRCNRDVAVIGAGMGGSLAFEAAIKRDDLEAAVAFGGFPQNYLGQFDQSGTPILAFFGSRELYTKPDVTEALRKELAHSHLAGKHEVVVVNGLGHEFFSDALSEHERELGRKAVNHTLAYLEKHLQRKRHLPQNNEIV